MSYLGKSIDFLSPYIYTATGNGVTTQHTLGWAAGTSHGVLVFLDGVNQVPGSDYTISGYTLTFTTAPASSTSIVVYGISISGITNTPPDNSITSNKLESLTLKSLASLTLSANNLIYSTGSDTVGLTPFTTYTKTLLETPDVATLRTNIGTVSLSTNETITGTKTFTNRPVMPNRPITYLSRSGHNSSLMIFDGKLYSTSGSSVGDSNSTTGRGLTGQNPFWGVDNFKQVPIPSTSPIVKAGTAGGYAVAWALLQDGSLYVWGQNGNGQLGIGNTTAAPTPVFSASGVVEVFSDDASASYHVNDHRLFIKKTDGYIYGCGYNVQGGVGVSHVTSPVSSWTQLTTLGTTVTKLFNFGSTYGFAFAQKSDDTIWAWGYNAQGQLGTGAITTREATPLNVTTNWQGGTGWVIEKMGAGSGYYDTAANGSGNTIMLLRNATTGASKLLTCGAGTWGSLGNGGTGNISTPYLHTTTNTVADIEVLGAGPTTVHYLDSAGNVYGWGWNGVGAVGDSTTTDRATPALVQTGVLAFYGHNQNSHLYGYKTTSFIKKADGYYATGLNTEGQCGVGDVTNRTSYTKMLFPGDIDIVEMGFFTTTTSGRVCLARTSDHRLYAWGYNAHNGITMGNTTNCLVPTSVALPE